MYLAPLCKFMKTVEKTDVYGLPTKDDWYL